MLQACVTMLVGLSGMAQQLQVLDGTAIRAHGFEVGAEGGRSGKRLAGHAAGPAAESICKRIIIACPVPSGQPVARRPAARCPQI